MKKKFKATSFLGNFLKKHWVLSLLLALAIVGASLSGLLPPFALRYIIDSEITPDLASPSSMAVGRLVGLAFVYYASYLLVGAFTMYENYMIDVFGQKLIHELRYQMILKSERLKVSYFTHHGSGEMSSRVTDDVYAIELLFADGLVSLIVSLFKIIGIWVSIFTLDYYLGLSLFVIIPLIALITRLFQKAMLKAQIANREVLNEESNHLSESSDNFRLLKDLGKESYRENNFVVLLKKGYRSQDKTSFFDSVYSPTIDFLKALLIAFLAYLVAYSYSSANLTLSISIGSFAAAMNLISSIFSPIQNIGEELQSMQEGISGIVRVEGFLNEEEVGAKDPALKASILFEKPQPTLLTFDHLSFHYDDGNEMIFEDLSLAIPEKDKVCLIGRTGAGKTTLFRLILGLLEPTEGAILLEGKEVGKIPDGEKRSIFGYVEQGFKPVPGTLKDQVTLGDGSISDAAVEQALKDSFLEEYIATHLPQGYATPFNPDDFSRGQLQLLGLARAIVSNPKILLLDEISANLDSKTEKDVIDALTLASKERTVISISHRLSDQLGFDSVFEIGHGQAVQKR
jgi:ATP-binding cassette, subfamily B, multidrug efflux pump